MLAYLDAKISFRQLLAFIPFVLLLHNCEEAITMPEWVTENISLLQEKIPFFQVLHFSSAQLFASLSLVTLLPFIVFWICRDGEKQSKKIKTLLLLQGIIFANVFVPHIGGSLVLMKYNPGVITAAMFNLPFSFYLFRRAVREGFSTKESLRRILIAAVVVYLPIVYGIHIFAEWSVGGL